MARVGKEGADMLALLQEHLLLADQILVVLFRELLASDWVIESLSGVCRQLVRVLRNFGVLTREVGDVAVVFGPVLSPSVLRAYHRNF